MAFVNGAQKTMGIDFGTPLHAAICDIWPAHDGPEARDRTKLFFIYISLLFGILSLATRTLLPASSESTVSSPVTFFDRSRSILPTSFPLCSYCLHLEPADSLKRISKGAGGPVSRADVTSRSNRNGIRTKWLLKTLFSNYCITSQSRLFTTTATKRNQILALK